MMEQNFIDETLDESAPSQKDISAADAFVSSLVSDNFKHVSREEEQALILAWQRDHNNEAIEKLLKVHEPFLKKVTNKYARKNPQIDLDDIYQEARIGFVTGVEKFDASFNVKLLTYAAWRIKQRVEVFLAGNRVIQTRPTHLGPEDKAVVNLYNDLMKKHNRRSGGQPPTQEERNLMSQELGQPLRNVEKLLALYYKPGFRWTSQYLPMKES